MGMDILWSNPQNGILLFLGILSLITLSNLYFLKRPSAGFVPETWPSLAVLIPARNEAHNLPACLENLAAQDYAGRFEVWVLDDHSTDGTGEIIARFSERDGRFRYLKGQPLPEGWLGKHWACQQLAEASQAEIYLFLDADTRLAPSTLRVAVGTMLDENIDLLSLVPLEEMLTWGERLILPYFLWALMAFYPLGLAFTLRWSWFSFTIGQFMLFRRSAYFAIGGHAAVRDDVVDDMALGRKVSAAGYCWRLMDGTVLVRCRMYHSFGEAWRGFSKNLFPVLGGRVLPFLFVYSWLGWVIFQPWAVVISAWLGFSLNADVGKALIAIGLALSLFTMAYVRLKVPVYLVAFYPMTMALNLMIGLYSLVLSLQGKASWKGRRLPVRKVRWL